MEIFTSDHRVLHTGVPLCCKSSLTPSLQTQNYIAAKTICRVQDIPPPEIGVWMWCGDRRWAVGLLWKARFECSTHLQVAERSPELSSTEAKRHNVEIAASGKLNLLGRMLEEINKQSLKALILYEANSYEHVGRDPIPAKRVDALTEFNAKHKKFLFLLEKHACLSVISLSSVNTVFIFNSDWTPMKSLKALERIKLDSQPEQIKIFRLYSPFTVEENILFFAKGKKKIDSLQKMSWITCHNLLMRGADNLFLTLRELNCGNTPVSSANTMSEKSLMREIEQLLLNGEGTGTINLSVILKVKVEGSYYMSSQMPIELLEISQEDYAEPSNYWNKLLKGKNTPKVVSEKVIKKRKVDKGSCVPFEQVFQDECTPISMAAQLQVSSAGGIERQLSSGGHTSNQPAQIPTRNAMSSHPDPCNSELQIIRKKMEEELKNHKEALLFEFEKAQTQYVNKAQELHSILELKLNELFTNPTMVLRSTMLAERHGQVPSGKQQDPSLSNYVDLSCGQQQEVRLTASSSSAVLAHNPLLNQSRPPNVSSISLTGNSRVNVIQAPAPHLRQTYGVRPSPSFLHGLHIQQAPCIRQTYGSRPSLLSSQQAPCNPTATSFPHLPS
uniref:Uncharacterized protein n=1 Tax=Quercus lobata TaxID=97700 RepID=A0A7N2N7L7_QUELO